MPSRTLPNLGLKAFYTIGESGWGDEMSLNLLRLSVLTQATAISKVAVEPGSPVDGDVHILDQTNPTNPNRVIIRDAGAWVYVAPIEGWLLYNRAANYFEKFDGTAWAEMATNSAGALPVGGATGQVLTKVSATDGDANWQTPGGSMLTKPLLADYPMILNAPTVSDGTSALIMTVAPGGTAIRARLRALPGGNFSVRCKLRAQLNGNNGAGLAFRDTGGRYVMIQYAFNQTLFVGNYNYSTATSFLNTVAQASFASGIPDWLRADFNSSNNDVSLFWSFNGVDWIAGATSGHLVTCDAWGLGTSINSLSTSTVFFEHIQII